MIIKQEQRYISPFAVSVIRLIESKNTRSVKDEYVVLCQLITPHAIIRLTKSKICSTIKYLESCLNSDVSSSVINRAINREYNAQIFTVSDRRHLHEKFLVNLRIALKLFRDIKGSSEPIDFELPEDGNMGTPPEYTAVYFDPRNNDTRRPITYSRFTKASGDGNGVPCLELGSGGTVCRLPLYTEHQAAGSKVEWTLKVLMDRFETVLGELIMNSISSTSPESLHYGFDDFNKLFYTRLTAEGQLIINYEDDFDIENSKVVVESREKSIFLMTNALRMLSNHSRSLERRAEGIANVSVA